MAAPKAPQLDASGKKASDVTLDEGVFAAEIRPHLVHEAVRSELNATRAGTAAWSFLDRSQYGIRCVQGAGKRTIAGFSLHNRR